jgi:surface protein
MATKKIYKNCTQSTYKVDNGSYSSTRPSSSEIANYRLKEQLYVKLNNSNQKVKKITTITYAKDGTGTANSVYKDASNSVISSLSESDWNSYTDKSIIENWTNGYLTGLLTEIIETGTITISDTADYYHGNDSEIFRGKFKTKAQLQTAVNAWNTDSTSATATYGEMSTWNVSAITDMSHLFRNKQNITSLDLSNWDVSNVLNMDYMFFESRNLNSITFGNNFDTSNVTSMKSMFRGIYSCYLGVILAGNCDTPALTSLDLSGFNTSSVEDMSDMFTDCLQLTNITFGNNFDISSVENMSGMFYNAQALTSLNISNWCVENLSEPTNFANYAPFAGTSSNLPNWGQSCSSS